ncbi:hypothetical protein A5680_21955 [Mycobacterium sp. E2989]|nr:hypothetical protein A5680_21955 [Mycobacterium sp. E2989]
MTKYLFHRKVRCDRSQSGKEHIVRFLVPSSIVDEVLEVCARRGVSAMPGNAEVSFPEPRGS